MTLSFFTGSASFWIYACTFISMTPSSGTVSKGGTISYVISLGSKSQDSNNTGNNGDNSGNSGNNGQNSGDGNNGGNQ